MALAEASASVRERIIELSTAVERLQDVVAAQHETAAARFAETMRAEEARFQAAVEREWRLIARERAVLREREASAQRLLSRANGNRIVRLNVGGTHRFTTTRELLLRVPSSVLATLVVLHAGESLSPLSASESASGSSRSDTTDAPPAAAPHAAAKPAEGGDEEIFIDRDGTYFIYILNWLRYLPPSGANNRGVSTSRFSDSPSAFATQTRTSSGNFVSRSTDDLFQVSAGHDLLGSSHHGAVLPPTIEGTQRLLVEAEFFGLDGLCKLLVHHLDVLRRESSTAARPVSPAASTQGNSDAARSGSGSVCASCGSRLGGDGGPHSPPSSFSSPYPSSSSSSSSSSSAAHASGDLSAHRHSPPLPSTVSNSLSRTVDDILRALTVLHSPAPYPRASPGPVVPTPLYSSSSSRLSTHVAPASSSSASSSSTSSSSSATSSDTSSNASSAGMLPKLPAVTVQDPVPSPLLAGGTAPVSLPASSPMPVPLQPTGELPSRLPAGPDGLDPNSDIWDTNWRLLVPTELVYGEPSRETRLANVARLERQLRAHTPLAYGEPPDD